MRSLVYVSSATELLAVSDLVDMLAAFRPRNEERGITGMLLYSGGNIIQALEGPAESVEQVFTIIEDDPRHSGVLVLRREEIATRAFPDWSMGFRDVGPGELPGLDGYTDFLQRSVGRDSGANGPAVYRLLELFRENMR